ncbi:CpsD/CapB family tyrosine-protein kinase [Paenalkalicoccus suaedae]|uniref:non-specific protein-tyrosine kinase n=1 Tax=Paenalkalicoccus suaedae TaxID=2592382 RepID=A0A859FGW4_9BACI|nr:CpsD/CapB family tyrosine-protein kinase [Paenalkalicoccus suaedae]QKS72613.1 CpsD/CapB family tyrosine-protein kinase [Paenalkalicoccus suaedae]
MALSLSLRRKKKDHLTEKQRSLITHFSPKSPVTEQYRTIRTNIQFSSVEEPAKVITVTSTAPGEGKSTTAANLAIVFAQQDNRVLLVDGDLRKPTSHYTFQADNKRGLTNVLTNQAALTDVSQKTLVPKLDLLTCGPIPPNPAELLASKRMDWVLQEAKKHYDYIIVDTPPVLAVTDAQILANKTDGVVLVTSNGMTTKDNAKKAKELLTNASARILGVVLNRKDKASGQYYYYGD